MLPSIWNQQHWFWKLDSCAINTKIPTLGGIYCVPSRQKHCTRCTTNPEISIMSAFMAISALHSPFPNIRCCRLNDVKPCELLLRVKCLSLSSISLCAHGDSSYRAVGQHIWNNLQPGLSANALLSKLRTSACKDTFRCHLKTLLTGI